MIKLLQEFEAEELPKLLKSPVYTWENVQGLLIDYHPPRVERLWFPWRTDYRVYLHRIHPVLPPHTPLYHNHPWPTAIKVVTGKCEHVAGFEGVEETSQVLLPGAYYEMVTPHEYHAVNPMDGPSLSLMITGRPWASKASVGDVPQRELRELTTRAGEGIRLEFAKIYGL